VRNDPRGFTLVEVLVVAVVLAAGIAGFLRSSLVAERLRARARLLSAAVLRAEAALERVGALGWEGATAGLPRDSLPGLLDDPGPHPVTRAAAEGASFIVVHERTADGAGPALVTVRCFWAAGEDPFRRRDAVALATRVP